MTPAGTLANTGSVVSSIVITCVEVITFPSASEAVNVLVITDVKPQPATLTSDGVTVSAPSQPSLAIAKSVGSGSLHSIVISDGIVTQVGAPLSV